MIFQYFLIVQFIFAKILIGSVWSSVPKMHLMLDRTNWKFGKQDINYLVLAVRIGRIVFPIFWKMLDHQGNSEQQIRIEFLNMFKEAFGFDCIASFSADREFIGQDWFDFLLKNNIPFFIRIKDNTLVNFGNTKINVKDLLFHLTQNQTRCLYNMFDNNQLFLCCKRINGEFLVICSNVQNSEKVFKIYRQRWDIERLFRNKKTQGFNLEKTHMQKLERLFLLMFLITVAIFISYMAGVLQKCSYKKTVKAPLYSIFTKGLRAIKMNMTLEFLEIIHMLQKSEG